MKRINQAEILLGIHLDELGVKYHTQYKFDEERRWTADFFIPSENILIEVDGGTGYFKNPKGQVIRSGRHNRKEGYEDDCRKLNTAALKHGFTCIRFTTGMVLNGEAKQFLSDNLIF